MEDIDKVLAYEIKKDIADRYFSFRKIIEQDSNTYLDAVVSSSLALEAGIGLDLIRLYILLRDQDLIARFQKLTTLPTDLFHDPYFLTSPTIRAKLFNGQPIRGFTRKGRFKNLFYDLYDRLHEETCEFHKILKQLQEQHQTISEQINIFYRRNDLNSILSFIRSLDRTDHGSPLLNQAPFEAGYESLDRKLQIVPPQPVETFFPEVPLIPNRSEIKKELRDLAETVFSRRPDLEARDFASPL